jgi:hypothetical protein
MKYNVTEGIKWLIGQKNNIACTSHSRIEQLFLIAFDMTNTQRNTNKTMYAALLCYLSPTELKLQ